MSRRTTEGVGTVAEGASVSPLVWALAIAQEHGGATRAVRATGLSTSSEDHEEVAAGLARMFVGKTPPEYVAEALALGLLAGVAHDPPDKLRDAVPVVVRDDD